MNRLDWYAGFLTLILIADVAAEETTPRTVLGYIYLNDLYTVKTGSTAEDVLNQIQISRLNESTVESKKNDIRLNVVIPNLTYRWRISHGQFWDCFGWIDWGLSTTRLPITDFYLYDRADPKRDDKVANRFPDELWMNSEYILTHTPAWELFRQITITSDPSPTYGDFFPISPKAGLLFLAYKNKCQVWRGTLSFDRKPTMSPKDRTEWTDNYTKEEVIEMEDIGSFTVFAHSKSYFFLTFSNKLHIATYVAKGNRKAVPFWDKPDQPIGQIITDTNTNRSFAFTQPIKQKDGTLAKPVYFELTEKLEPKEYDPTKLRVNKLESPMKEVRQAVDLLIDLGEIKLPKGKEKK